MNEDPASQENSEEILDSKKEAEEGGEADVAVKAHAVGGTPACVSVTPRELEVAFKKARAESGHKGFCRDWTVAEREGCGKNFLKACQQASLEPLRALRVALRDWEAIKGRAKEREGAYPLPDEPSIAWLAKYANSAIDYIREAPAIPRPPEVDGKKAEWDATRGQWVTVTGRRRRYKKETDKWEVVTPGTTKIWDPEIGSWVISE